MVRRNFSTTNSLHFSATQIAELEEALERERAERKRERKVSERRLAELAIKDEELARQRAEIEALNLKLQEVRGIVGAGGGWSA